MEEELDDPPVEETEITAEPKFKTQGSTFTFDRGTTIRLPCVLHKFEEGENESNREVAQQFFLHSPEMDADGSNHEL